MQKGSEAFFGATGHKPRAIMLMKIHIAHLVSAKLMVNGSGTSAATFMLALGRPAAVPGRLGPPGMISTAAPPEAAPMLLLPLPRSRPPAVAPRELGAEADAAAAIAAAAAIGSAASGMLSWRDMSRDTRGLHVGVRQGATCRSHRTLSMMSTF